MKRSIHVLVVDTEDSPYPRLLAGKSAINGVSLVRTGGELTARLVDRGQPVDLVIVSLLLANAAPFQYQRRVFVEIKGLELLRDGVLAHPSIPFVAAIHCSHVQTVMKAYDAGASWCISRQTRAVTGFTEKLLQLTDGTQLAPAVDTHTTNFWLAKTDPRLAQCSERDVEILEHLLLELEPKALRTHLGLANMATLRSRLARLLDRTDLDSQEALVVHARRLGITPPSVTS